MKPLKVKVRFVWCNKTHNQIHSRFQVLLAVIRSKICFRDTYGVNSSTDSLVVCNAYHLAV
jgi:hypothetical protein